MLVMANSITDSVRRTIRKLGEGVYSEVFSFEDSNDDKSVLKVCVKLYHLFYFSMPLSDCDLLSDHQF